MNWKYYRNEKALFALVLKFFIIDIILKNGYLKFIQKYQKNYWKFKYVFFQLIFKNSDLEVKSKVR